MSYAIDIYRKVSEPVKRFMDFACYVSMFPQLVAGPIIRFRQIADQLKQRDVNSHDLLEGIRRFVVGLAKKVVLADSLGSVADDMLTSDSSSTAMLWTGIAAFSLQIYFDFSGYSDMAIGLARMLGFRFPENFNLPYAATSISEFWRRWHMSLSGWLRDYVYIPLGGSKASSTRVQLNLFVTMLICGLWHGANWTFVLWGAYFGCLLSVERQFGFHHSRETRSIFLVVILRILTSLFVLIGWVFFRASSVSEAYDWLFVMVGFDAGCQGCTIPSLSTTLTIVILYFCSWIDWTVRIEKNLTGVSKELVTIFLLMISIVVVEGAENSPFLYFQF